MIHESHNLVYTEKIFFEWGAVFQEHLNHLATDLNILIGGQVNIVLR